MKYRQILLTALIVMTLGIVACSKSGGTTPDNPNNNNNNNNNNNPVGNSNGPKTQADISDSLVKAIKTFTTTVSLNMSASSIADNQVTLSATNAYWDALNKDSSLKYAYAINPTYNSSTKMLTCMISYMPYKLGIDSTKVPSSTYKIRSYNDLITILNSSSVLGQSGISIAILNKDLDFNTMQLVLNAECGYGYIVYQFNNDATSITAAVSPQTGTNSPVTMADCLARISRSKDSVTSILGRIITPGMPNDQKVNAIYNFVAPTVTYDPLSSDKSKMSFDSQTAYGALVNHTAICGGYSWAFKMLLDAAGIQCYFISGKGNGIAHAWNRASYNGGYYYFDCTWGHNYSDNRYFAKTESAFQADHIWNDTMEKLLVSEK
jgi:hypothetical protein